jgi:hypothetical protein
MTENEFKYWAFLSYSQQDNCPHRPGEPEAGRLCWGDWWRDELNTFTIPAIFTGQINARGEIIPERIAPIFQDQEEQPEDGSLSERVRQALEQSRCLLVICSPRSAQSLHVNEAVRYFKQLGRGNRILPIIVAGEPNASDDHPPGKSSGDECFVPALRHPLKPDGTLDAARRERGSIFADARQGAAKREWLATDQPTGETELEIARIQLIAGLIGVGFNGLWERELKRRFTEAQIQAQAVRQQILETRTPDAEAQNKVQEALHQARVAQQQIQELRNQAQATQSQISEAQQQVREALYQVAEARNQAQIAESKVHEAQQQARETQQHLEAAREQVRAAQTKILEKQNLPQDDKSLIQEAQNQVQEAQAQARVAQSQAEAARNEARESQNKLLAAQNQVREAQARFQETDQHARQTQTQLAEARKQGQAAESEMLEAQQQARAAQSQAEAARKEAREVQNQFLEAQRHARAAQDQVHEVQRKTLATRRLTKVFALLAVLAALAASMAWWQRKLANQALAKAATTEVRQSDRTAGPLNGEQIRQTLQNMSEAGLAELVARIPTEQIPATLNAAAIILNDPQRSHFQEQLLDEWMKSNLPAAFDWICQLTNVHSRQHALEKIIPALAAGQLTNTLSRLNDLQPVPNGRIYTALFQRWAATDPVQALEQRQQIPGHDADARILSAILTDWADQHPAAAVNWLASQPDAEALPAGTWRNRMIAGLFDSWAAKDLAAATTACEQLPDGPARENASEFVLNQRIAKDPASAAEVVKNLPLGDHRQTAIGALCQQWADTNAPAALEWAHSLPSQAERMAVTNQVIVKWAQNDPQAATQFADQHPELSGAVFGEIASAWFQRDFTATTNWVASLPDGEKKNAAQLALVETWAQNDPKGMAAYALGLPAGEIQTQYLTAAGRALAIRDFPGTVALLQPLSDAALRQTILESAARHCDPLQLNQWAKYIATMPVGDDQQAAIKGLVASWAPADPETALNWLIAFPATNAQPELVSSVIHAWSESEPAMTAKWLARLPPEIPSEGMVSAFLEGAAAKYPEVAAQWTQSVTDETKRQKCQIEVARQWLKTDESAAMKWIESLGLPEAIKQTLKAPSP